MVLLDELPLDILLAVVKGLKRRHWHELDFYELLPVASVNTSLRRSLLPLLYSDLLLEFPVIFNRNYKLREAESNGPPKVMIRTRHNAALAHSAGCSEYVQRVLLFVNERTALDDIVRAVRDDMDVGSETKWPNLCSYACNYDEECWDGEDWFSCSDIITQLDKELPRLRHASPGTCEVSSCITPLVYTPPSVSFLTQLTSLCLSCYNQGIDTNRLPQIFAPTLVNLTLRSINPEDIWNAFYDGHENQTVVFPRLKRLVLRFENPLCSKWGNGLPPHLQGATNSALAKRSVWAAGAASGKPGCRVPLFPVLRTLWCTDMTYNFRDFVSRTQCHNSLVSLYVSSAYVYFDFDVSLFKNLEAVVFDTSLQGTNKESAGSVDLYKSAFTSLLRTNTNMRRIAFRLSGCGTLFQVPSDIGCVNLHSLFLGVEIDFKSMLRLLKNLKHLIELELGGDRSFAPIFDDGRVDTAEDIDEVQPPHVDYLLVSSTLRRFTCYVHTSMERCCYTAAYALELALHLPALKSMTLGVLRKTAVPFYEALLNRFTQRLPRHSYMNDGLWNAKVVPQSSPPWYRYSW
ncbi:hypothetical protein GQ54DRAFT_300755 [Martensiomyces pterosporus]|nr:hypothetical protein GQ54DRAFT_300755 [Martensiomyces pterosporus]